MRAIASPPATVHSRKKLLLVEDDESVLASLRLVLNADYEVYSADTVRSGIDLFSQLNPSLVVLDLRLPDGNGLEVLREIRTREHEAPVIIVTGYASMRTVEEALRLGASDYLHKPFDGLRLKDRVRQLIAPDSAQAPQKPPTIPVSAQRLDELECKAKASAMFLHDVANPVTAALSASQVISEHLETHPGDFRTELQDACSLLNSALGLLAGLFEQGAAMESLRRLEKCEVPLRRITDLAVNMAQLEPNRDQVNISVRIQGADTKVCVNQFAIARVLLNLLRNAITAVEPRSGEVIFSAKVANDCAEFSVCDNGSGIPPEIMDRIFDAHFTTKSNGGGLGLYICKRLVEVMQGSLSVRNEPKHGCCFSVRIPCKI